VKPTRWSVWGPWLLGKRTAIDRVRESRQERDHRDDIITDSLFLGFASSLLCVGPNMWCGSRVGVVMRKPCTGKVGKPPRAATQREIEPCIVEARSQLLAEAGILILVKKCA
jgi:hypothetical protein